MAYKLLGMVIWKVGKSLLRYRLGGVKAPRSLLAGGAALIIAGVVLAAARQRGGGD
jgi:hypothetical protein